ncbi:MAG: hypothetical protein NTV46_06145 [Verrucomicrobia bacterium]|nr:hypothetical protein [Verrucomicrobiota bacterium]
MQFTQYFLHTRNRPDRAIIQEEWIRSVLEHPEKTQVQSDGRLRFWGRIKEMDNRTLRVIVLEDGTTVHNAFFDRNTKL